MADTLTATTAIGFICSTCSDLMNALIATLNPQPRA
jgi:hypothetical protein